MGFLENYRQTLKQNVLHGGDPAQKAEREATRASAPSTTIRFTAKLHVKNGQIVHGRERHPLAGAHATVDSAGEIDRRITATRLVLTGAFALALRKKNDNRQLFLLVEGPGFGFVEEVNPRLQRQAREFAVKLNAAASQQPRAVAPVRPPAGKPSVSPTTASGAALIRESQRLQRELAAGAITEAEYQERKAALYKG